MTAMKLTFVNVGYGEAMLVECPDPARPGGLFTMVIDGGSGEASEYADDRSGRIPMADYLADRGLDHIDVMVVTHIHEDHICGLPALLERWKPTELWQSLPKDLYKTQPEFASFPGADASQDKFRRALNDYRAMCAVMEGHIHTLSAGWSAAPCPGLTVQVLAPSAEKAEALERACRELSAAAGTPEFPGLLSRLDGRMNNYSLILSLTCQGVRILLPGDTNCAGYGGIDPAQLRADIFKVGHHGQRDGADQALLSAVRPKAVVCCASSDRRYESAWPDTLHLIQANGARLWFSDCPALPELDTPPHRALVFTVGGPEGMTACYQ